MMSIPEKYQYMRNGQSFDLLLFIINIFLIIIYFKLI